MIEGHNSSWLRERERERERGAMALCNLGGGADLKIFDFSSKNRHSRLIPACKLKCSRLESFSGLKGVSIVRGPVHVNGVNRKSQRLTNHVAVSCLSNTKSDMENANVEEQSTTKDQIFPGSFKVHSLLTAICDTTSIAEVELKIGGFRVYVKRDLADKSIPAPAPNLPIQPTNTPIQASDSNGSTAATSLNISKPKQLSILERASDEGLVILQSPKVGFFRTSRTIKGKRAPVSCKEKQEVKEGQVLCYVEQLGGEIPIESDVSGEVIKILRTDGEPVGYGDALIAILPSFPGIKKLQ
ncbi:uncharacterized protein LOC109835680 isoform X2 [Asparagus officinalis]|uniref:uncharacterized protein LOC109835680 isoform X2 n=1 Tax=Asparagus officinalis TaxID=4686 RepID=UPI00098DEAAC|nr:uncharacterized protein LOC109835680 isoform X2 [Asparagus officinalis]